MAHNGTSVFFLISQYFVLLVPFLILTKYVAGPGKPIFHKKNYLSGNV